MDPDAGLLSIDHEITSPRREIHREIHPPRSPRFTARRRRQKGGTGKRRDSGDANDSACENYVDTCAQVPTPQRESSAHPNPAAPRSETRTPDSPTRATAARKSRNETQSNQILSRNTRHQKRRTTRLAFSIQGPCHAREARCSRTRPKERCPRDAAG